MKWTWMIGGLVSGLLMQPAWSSAASPYDDYYDSYGSYEQPENAPPMPVDNDSYYSAPGTYVTDNDVYYTPPDSPGGTYSAQTNPCNTIGDMPSCGAN